MLYDPKWEVKVEPLSLQSLIAWLATQPASFSYDYRDTRTCLATQYYWQHGLPMRVFWLKGYQGEEPPPCADAVFGYKLEWLAREEPWTYGAALTRARELAAHAEHAGDSAGKNRV